VAGSGLRLAMGCVGAGSRGDAEVVLKDEFAGIAVAAAAAVAVAVTAGDGRAGPRIPSSSRVFSLKVAVSGEIRSVAFSSSHARSMRRGVGGKSGRSSAFDSKNGPHEQDSTQSATTITAEPKIQLGWTGAIWARRVFCCSGRR
jgi:hypothetical protein